MNPPMRGELIVFVRGGRKGQPGVTLEALGPELVKLECDGRDVVVRGDSLHTALHALGFLIFNERHE